MYLDPFWQLNVNNQVRSVRSVTPQNAWIGPVIPLFGSVNANNDSLTLLKSHQIVLEFNGHTSVRIKQLLGLRKVAGVLGHSDASGCVKTRS